MKRTYKELFILLLSFSIIFSSCIGAFFANPDKVYAEVQWENVSQDDLVTAFRYYCKSRNLVVDGSAADALTSFTTTTFNNICNTLGINITALQADLKKTVEGNLGLRFLFNQQGVLAYNRIFAEFLQNNDLTVGDTVDNKIIYSGEYYSDDDGNTCLVWELKSSSRNISVSQYGIPDSYFVKYGSYLKYSPDNFVAMINGGVNSVTFHVDNSTVNVPIGISTYNQGQSYCYNNNNYYSFRQYTKQGTLTKCYGCVGVAKISAWDNSTHGYALVIPSYNTAYYKFDDSNVDDNHYGFAVLKVFSDNPTEDTNITVNTPEGTTINNNTYNNNWTIIYNGGDTYITDDDDEPSPTTPPGGGGGGDDDPSDPDVPSYDPYPGNGGPSTPGTTTTGSDGVFKLPHLGFDFPEIDWSLKNIGDKFPFCIPGDIVSVLTLLNASPEAPKLQATIPIPHVYDWEINIDFSEYDRYAFIIRTVEFLGFVISLIYLTIRMVKG